MSPDHAWWRPNFPSGIPEYAPSIVVFTSTRSISSINRSFAAAITAGSEEFRSVSFRWSRYIPSESASRYAS